MASKKVTTSKSKAVLITFSFVLSLLLTGYFTYGILRLVQNLKSGIIGSPNFYAFVPAALMAIYIFLVAEDKWDKYYAVLVVTMLLMGLLVWLLGATNVGSFLV